MSWQRYTELVSDLCGVMCLPDAQAVIDSRCLEVEGFHVVLDHVDSDPEAMYLQFDYGIPAAQRTLRVFRLMLESNLLIYAQDQAQLGIDPDTGAALLIVRVAMYDNIDGGWLADLLMHYAEHGRYWRDNMMQARDELFDNIASGAYHWIKV